MIRTARLTDAPAIKTLLDQLEYPGTDKFLEDKMRRLLQHPDAELVVYELEGRVVGFIAIAFITQLAVEGDFARISYFAVDETTRSQGVGKALEAYCTQRAAERHCSLVEVHCHERRKEAHRFYYRQGYSESPKYLIKRLPAGMPA